MDRENKIKKAYGGDAKFFKSTFCARKIADELERRYKEDAGRDITAAAVIRDHRTIRGMIKAKEPGILAGISDVSAFYRRHGLKARILKKDGCVLKRGDMIAEVRGPEGAFLATERTGLNILQRMSGIATAAKRLADIAGRYGAAVAGTRKTLLLYPDKKAIWLGGCLPHRLGLFDAILVKDNHLSAIAAEGESDPITAATRRACRRARRLRAKFIEIEAPDRKSAMHAARAYKEEISADNGYIPFTIMLDNMRPAEIRKTTEELKASGLYGSVLLEASGNITPGNISACAQAGVDVVSLGWLTHSARALDISQKITG